MSSAGSRFTDKLPAVPGRYRGELFCLLGSLCFAFSGTVAKILLLSGLSPWRLTQVRCAGALLLLGPVMLLSRGPSLRIARADLMRMVVFGVVGVAVVQALYFVAIARVSIGIALLLEFTAPVWILLYLRFWKGVAVPQGLWLALGLSLSGLLLITEAWQGLKLDAVGVAAALLDALALAVYYLLGDRLSRSYSGMTLSAWGFAVTTVMMVMLQPFHTFPVEVLSMPLPLLGRFAHLALPGWALLTWVVVFGTVVPYVLVANGLRLLRASTASLLGMTEPVMAGLIAWWWLGEALTPVQLAGSVVVLAGVMAADRVRSAVASD
ncbi:MAG: hypothetical protein FJW29_00345 [Acidobacteria bacterium]|nr:hypothetical protein [Acidobacteriota bacterium]